MIVSREKETAGEERGREQPDGDSIYSWTADSPYRIRSKVIQVTEQYTEKESVNPGVRGVHNMRSEVVGLRHQHDGKNSERHAGQSDTHKNLRNPIEWILSI
jgi:hypothetical protein